MVRVGFRVLLSVRAVLTVGVGTNFVDVFPRDEGAPADLLLTDFPGGVCRDVNMLLVGSRTAECVVEVTPLV